MNGKKAEAEAFALAVEWAKERANHSEREASRWRDMAENALPDDMGRPFYLAAEREDRREADALRLLLARTFDRDINSVEGVVGAVENVTDTAAELHLSVGEWEVGPWLTALRDHYPADLWPPKRGDIITVTVPTVLGVRRGA
jgi:hypothetical protein